MVGSGERGADGVGGAALAAEMNSPVDLTFDAGGNLYIAESYGSQIVMVAPEGSLTLIAGNGASGYSGDGGPAAGAQLDVPAQVTFGPDGNLYIADANNHRIRMVIGVSLQSQP